MAELDLEAVKRTWLNQCGPCDYGMPEYGCTHPQEDYRPVIMSLVLKVERLSRATELLHICYGCQQEIAVADQLVVTMPDAIEYWHGKCHTGEGT